MAMPTTTIEVAFATDPGAAPTWTDISAYQKTFVVHRGRADDQAAFGPGQLQLTLTNEDRRFDPAYTSSPYYPNVLPMRRIRIRSTWNAVTYDVFNGYVTNWQQQYSPPQDAECVVTATDAFKVLANISLPDSVWEAEVRADNPASWYRLDDPAGSTVLADQIGGRDLNVLGAPTLGAAGHVAHDPDAAIAINTATDGAASAKGTTIATTYPLLLAVIVKTTSSVAQEIMSLRDADNGPVVALFSDSSNALLQAWTNTGNGFTVSAATITDGNPHLVVGVWDAAGGLTLYIDGVASGTPGTAVGTIGISGQPPTTVWVGGGQAYSGGINQGLVGTIDEAAVFNTAVSAARIAAWAGARSAPWSGDLSGARINRVLDAAGWPTADRNIDAGMAVLQSADLAQTALSILQKIEQTEQGALFVSGDGKVRFIARDSLLKAPYTTSQGTFGDSGSELEYGDLKYRYDDSLIFNEVRVSRLNGAAVVVKDTTSQTRYLRRTRTLDGLLHQSDATSTDLANWTLAHSKDPTLRVTGMRLEPSAGNETTHFPQVLGREPMDRVTVLRRPQNLGAAISQDTLIEGMTHTVTAMQWITEWNLSPAEAQQYWILGVAGYSELGQTTRLGF